MPSNCRRRLLWRCQMDRLSSAGCRNATRNQHNSRCQYHEGYHRNIPERRHHSSSQCPGNMSALADKHTHPVAPVNYSDNLHCCRQLRHYYRLLVDRARCPSPLCHWLMTSKSGFSCSHSQSIARRAEPGFSRNLPAAQLRETHTPSHPPPLSVVAGQSGSH